MLPPLKTVKQDYVKWERFAQEAFKDSMAVKGRIVESHLLKLVNMAYHVAKVIQNRGTLFLCGNGGSLADAQHLAAELLVRLRPLVNRKSLPALCLATDMSTVTACGNDYGFEEIFSRSLEGLGQQGDVVLGISTSGNSKNILKVFEKARELGITTMGFLGCGGGLVKKYADMSFIVPSDITARIQESHITAGHVLLEMVEEMLEDSGYLKRV